MLMDIDEEEEDFNELPRAKKGSEPSAGKGKGKSTSSTATKASAKVKPKKISVRVYRISGEVLR